MSELAKKKVHTVLPGDTFGLAEHKRNDWVADIPADVAVTDIEDPACWVHVGAQMQTLDTIEARWVDSSKVVHLRVIWTRETLVKVKVTGVEELDSTAVEDGFQSAVYEIKWRGPTHKFSVVRKSDGKVISHGHEDRSVAETWANTNN